MFSSRTLCSSSLRTSGRTYNYKAALSRLSIPRQIVVSLQTTATRSLNTILPLGEKVTGFTGQSGQHYSVYQVLQEETFPKRLVYLASANDQNFILKYVHEVNYKDLEAMNSKLRVKSSYVRLIKDMVLKESMFVFPYFTGHLLHLAQKDLPLATTKRVLKDALRGLAELHSQNIVHTDIKADNILIDWKEKDDTVMINRVQLGDLEDATYIPPGAHMIGKQAGNWMWRSPEAHAGASLNTPSDVFSFALICIYAVYKRVIFAVGDDELEEGIEPLAIAIERQISYFADPQSLDRFLKYLDDSPWVQIFEVIRDGFNEDNPRQPFSLWQDVDEDFRDLVCAMTNFDPEKRITAHQALAHRWFEDI